MLNYIFGNLNSGVYSINCIGNRGFKRTRSKIKEGRQRWMQ